MFSLVFMLYIFKQYNKQPYLYTENTNTHYDYIYMHSNVLYMLNDTRTNKHESKVTFNYLDIIFPDLHVIHANNS